MTERRYFVTKCPTCRGMLNFAVKEGYWVDDPKPESPQNQKYIGPVMEPCPSCDGKGKVIAQVLAPFVQEETWAT